MQQLRFTGDDPEQRRLSSDSVTNSLFLPDDVPNKKSSLTAANEDLYGDDEKEGRAKNWVIASTVNKCRKHFATVSEQCW